MKRTSNRQWKLAVPFLATLLLLTHPAHSTAADDFRFVQTHRVRLAATMGAFRVSHDRFPDVYTSRWTYPVGGIVQVRVKGFPVLLSIRHLSQKKRAGQQEDQGGTACTGDWQQTVFNLGVGTSSSRVGRFQSQVAFGLSIHRIKEPSPFPIMGRCSSTATGFFIMTEVEYFLLPRIGVGWQFELSSAGAQKTAAFEANSVGGLYFGGTLNLGLF